LGEEVMQVEGSSKQNSLLEQLKDRFPIQDIPPYGSVLVVPAKLFKNGWKERLEIEGVKIYVSNYGSQACFFVRKVEQEKQNQTIEESSIPVQKAEIDSKPSPVKEKKPWTLEERVTLKQLLSQSQRVPIIEIAEKLGRSVYSIGAEISHLKRKEKPEEANSKKKPFKKLKPWTFQDKTTLKQLYSQVPIIEIAQKLGRTSCAIDSKAHDMKLRRSKPSVESHSAQPSEAKPKIEDPDIVKEFLEASALLYPSHKSACAFLLKAASERMENRSKL
jgi:hypothetical protein